MEQLFSVLEAIRDLLEQIYGITQNQMTILLDTQLVGEGLDMIEQMAAYKEQLTSEVEERESVFQELYTQYRDSVETVEDKKRLKNSVDAIMKLKASIVENEQKNVIVMQDLLRRCAERVTLPKNPQHVANLYKGKA